MLAPLLQLRFKTGSATMTVVGMPQAKFEGASPNARLLVGEMPAAHQLKTSLWEGTGVSVVVHVVVLGILIYAATHVTQVVQTANQFNEKFEVIFLDKKGPGGGGGGRPKDPAPPRKAEVVATKPVQVTPIPRPSDTPVLERHGTLVQTAISRWRAPDDTAASCRGGAKSGTGASPGTADWATDRVADSVEIGKTASVAGADQCEASNYTGDAMRAETAGALEMEAVVVPDGSVDPATASRLRAPRLDLRPPIERPSSPSSVALPALSTKGRRCRCSEHDLHPALTIADSAPVLVHEQRSAS